MTDYTTILGVQVAAVNPSRTIEIIDQFIRNGEKSYITVTGVHGVIESQDSTALKDIHNQAGLVVPDGMPLVWISRLSGHKNVGRVYGPDLMLAVCHHSQKLGHRHFFYGGGDGVNEYLCELLLARYPELQIAGTYTPPFRPLTPEEDREVIDKINASNADIVWIGLSTPKQEFWMAEHLGKLNAAVLVGVGAAFDFNAGLKKQAPAWIQRNGLEWLFRMLTEPRRLAGRYIRIIPRFIYLYSLQLVGFRRNQ